MREAAWAERGRGAGRGPHPPHHQGSAWGAFWPRETRPSAPAEQARLAAGRGARPACVLLPAALGVCGGCRPGRPPDPHVCPHWSDGSPEPGLQPQPPLFTGRLDSVGATGANLHLSALASLGSP